MKNLLAPALLLVPALAGAATPESSPVSAAEKAAAQAITENVLRGHVRFLASDLLEGRAPASRGEVIALQYVQAQMEALGLEPGAPGGGWIQKVPLVGIVGNVPQKTTVTKGSEKVDFTRLDDYVAFSGTQKPQSTISGAEVVFVGYGIVAPEFQWDDYKDVDVKGKVLLMMNNDPEDDPKLFAGKTRLWYGRWDYKYMIAAQKGAIGAFIIHTQPSAGYPWQVVTSSWSRGRVTCSDSSTSSATFASTAGGLRARNAATRPATAARDASSRAASPSARSAAGSAFTLRYTRAAPSKSRARSRDCASVHAIRARAGAEVTFAKYFALLALSALTPAARSRSQSAAAGSCPAAAAYSFAALSRASARSSARASSTRLTACSVGVRAAASAARASSSAS